MSLKVAFFFLPTWFYMNIPENSVLLNAHVPFLLAHVYLELYSCHWCLQKHSWTLWRTCGAHFHFFLKAGGKVSTFWKQTCPCEKYVIFGFPHSVLERKKPYSLSHFPIIFINFTYLAEEMFLKMSSIWRIWANLILNIQLIWIISTEIFKDLITLEKCVAI